MSDVLIKDYQQKITKFKQEQLKFALNKGSDSKKSLIKLSNFMKKDFKREIKNLSQRILQNLLVATRVKCDF